MIFRRTVPLVLCCLAGLASAQDPQPADVERVYIPENGFDRVLKKHPRGVIVSEAELRDLLAKAGVRPSAPEPDAPPPVAAMIERLSITGAVEGDLVLLKAQADVAVLAPGVVPVQLPLAGIGLRRVRLGDTDRAARVFRTRRGTEVLLKGPAPGEGPVVRKLSWEFAVRVEPGDERGSGTIRFPVPAVASGRLTLSLPGDMELANADDLTGKGKGKRARNRVTHTDGTVLWVKSAGDAGTQVEGAFGGRGRANMSVSYRPRRSTIDVTPYAAADARSLFLVRQGVVTLHGAAKIEVYRAGRERFRLRLPEGFVVRALTVSPGDLTYVQKGTDVDVRLDTERQGQLVLRVEAELATGAGEAQDLSLRPIGYMDLDRVVGATGLVSGAGSIVTFGDVEGLERADLAELGLGRAIEGGTLLRVYRRGRAASASIAVSVKPIQPRVDLSIKAALALAEREVKAVTLYTYEVETGRVFVVRARLPQGYTFEGATVRDGNRSAVKHQLKEEQVVDPKTKTESTEIVVELEAGLSPGQLLLLTVQATSQRPKGLAGTRLSIPHFSGSPADHTRGHLGFAPDESFTLAGTGLRSLVAIPAEELPRVGVDVAGLVLGYRIEHAAYSGQIAIDKKQTQVMAEILARHRVHERVIESDVRLNLDVEGAPIKTLDLQLPEGTGLLAKIEGDDLRDDRDLLGSTDGGLETWRLRFDRPKKGSFVLRVRFGTKLEAKEGQTEITAPLPRVSLGAAAFRERGTLAVYSSDSTELVPQPKSLRAIEVTEVPGVLVESSGERPLFAYTHVGRTYGLNLEIKRHGTGEVLTAVSEQLVLDTAAGPDGTSRHTATFHVKNLNNQFFALQLPTDAVLWSVVVDGEGVKPAERDGLKLIPIPTAGTKGPDQITEVEAIYTVKATEWGMTGSAGLEAPILLKDGDAVPVLKTTWRLALPDDYRVLEWAGNVNGPPVAVSTPLLGNVWSMAVTAQWPLWIGVLALFGLGLGVSKTLRRGSLRVILAGSSVGTGVGTAVRSPALRRVALIGLIAALGLLVVGFLLNATLLGARDAPVASAPQQEYRSAGSTDDAEKSWGGGGDAGGEAFSPPMDAEPAEPPTAMSLAPPAPPKRPMEQSADMPAPKTAAARPAGAKDKADSRLRGRRDFAKLRSELGRQQQQKQRRRKGDSLKEEEKAMEKADRAMDFDEGDALDDMPGDDTPDSEEEAEAEGMPSNEPMPSLDAPDESREALNDRMQDADGRVDQLFGETETSLQLQGYVDEGNKLLRKMAEDKKSGDSAALERDVERVRELVTQMNDEGQDVYRKNAGALWSRASALSDGKLGELSDLQVLSVNTEEKPMKRLPVRHSQLGSFGQVGLRSLVMELPAVGHQHEFARPGGEAVLSVRFVREASLVTAAGVLALLGFLTGLLLPRSGKLSTTGLIAVGLGVLTAVPVVVAGSWFTPLLNAVALGLLVAAPVSALFALGAAWKTAPFTRLRTALQAMRDELADAPRPAPASAPAAPSGGDNRSTTRIVFSLFLLAAAFLPLQAVDAQETKQDERPQVFVPYDPGKAVDPTSDEGPDKVYVPLDVYEDLHRRAFPETVTQEAAPPPANTVVAETAYEGTLDGGGLRLTANVRVGVLGEGWQRCFLGLQGTGLQASTVQGTHDGARVAVAPAGGFELVAKGPGSYRVSLDLVVPQRSGGYTFATVPCFAATLAVKTTAKNQRLVVGGARAQKETSAGGGAVVVDASLGDAKTVTLSLRSREEMSSGASEASAHTRTLVWVQRGRMSVVSETTFSVSGAGREGFVFGVPKGFEVTDVHTPGLRSWSSEGGRVELKLRRPTGKTAVVRISGEQRIEPGTTRFDAPEIAAQGVSRESGTIGISVEQGLRVRPVKPRLRQVDVGRVTSLAQMLRAGGVESAYGFARRPATLALELVSESVEAKADVNIQATVLSDIYVVEATLNYDVTRGKLYTLQVMAPKGLELAGTPQGLDVREVRELKDKATETSRIYELGLASGLKGSGSLVLTFGKRLSLQNSARLPFPDVRPLGVSRETATIALGSASALGLRVPTDPGGLSPRDVRRLSLRAPRSGVKWRLAYARPNGRVRGLAVGDVVVTQDKPYVTGSWVLHARVERDVIRYSLRAFYEIEHAGVQKFQILVPESAGERVTVDAQNQREVTNALTGDGQRRYTVELQSPALGVYNLGLSWEEVLHEGRTFQLPNVGVAGVDRQVRGFLLVEKAPEVVDVLDQVSTSGSVKADARASDAPALPPGKGPRDFVFAYSVPLTSKEPWTVKCQMKKADVKLPPAARIPWARFESVFSREGEVRHRARFRVHNLRLQFLSLELPAQAKMWSVFVDGSPKRLHTDGKLALVPLPKRSAADLSFDVELIYATPKGNGFGDGERQDLVGPLLRTEGVKVEKTFWSVYTPSGYDCSGFAGNVDPAVAGTQDATVLEAEVQEYARLADLAQRAQGKKKAVADYNLRQQQQRITEQIAACDYNSRTLALDSSQPTNQSGEQAKQQFQQASELVALNNDTYNKLNFQIEDRRKRDEKELEREIAGQQALAQDEVQVDGNTFQRAESGWATNTKVYKKGNKVQWEGVNNDPNAPNSAPTFTNQMGQGGGGQSKQTKRPSNYSIVLKEGEELSIKNAGIAQESAQEQRSRGGQYGYYQQRANRQKEQEAQQLDALRSRLPVGGLVPSQDPVADGVVGGEFGAADNQQDAGRASEGLMSIRVDFNIPAESVAHHFANETTETPVLAFKSHSTDRGDTYRALASALVLLVLLAGVVRLGLLRSVPRHFGQQALALLGAVFLAYLVFLHPVGAVLTFLLSLLAIRHGPLAALQPTAEA